MNVHALHAVAHDTGLDEFERTTQWGGLERIRLIAMICVTIVISKYPSPKSALPGTLPRPLEPGPGRLTRTCRSTLSKGV